MDKEFRNLLLETLQKSHPNVREFIVPDFLNKKTKFIFNDQVLEIHEYQIGDEVVCGFVSVAGDVPYV